MTPRTNNESGHATYLYHNSANHSAITRRKRGVAALRAIIQAGADVHQLDQEPIVDYNKGRPLYASIDTSYSVGGARLKMKILPFS